MASNGDIVVVGCINTDLVAFVARLPSPGETVFSSGLETHFGGKGANQAAQAALLFQTSSSTGVKVRHECAFGEVKSSHIEQFDGAGGAAAAVDVGSSSARAKAGAGAPACGVAMVGRIGRDTAGASFLRHFSSLNIDTRGVSIDPDHPTGSALITVAEGGENTIAYVPAANGILSKEHVSAEPTFSLLKNAKVIVSENGVPGEATVACFRIAKEANPQVLSVFTPAPADRVNPEICCFTDFLLCNRLEAQALLGAWGGETSRMDSANESEIARRLHDGILHTAKRFPKGACGLANVVITNGSKPCVVFANGKTTEVPLAKHIPSELVVDTTGAGDSFAGAFAYFLLLTPHSPETAVSRATFVSALSVTKKGAAESYVCSGDLPDSLFQKE